MVLALYMIAGPRSWRTALSVVEAGCLALEVAEEIVAEVEFDLA
jgi:hypothetical protein